MIITNVLCIVLFFPSLNHTLSKVALPYQLWLRLQTFLWLTFASSGSVALSMPSSIASFSWISSHSLQGIPPHRNSSASFSYTVSDWSVVVSGIAAPCMMKIHVLSMHYLGRIMYLAHIYIKQFKSSLNVCCILIFNTKTKCS